MIIFLLSLFFIIFFSLALKNKRKINWNLCLYDELFYIYIFDNKFYLLIFNFLINIKKKLNIFNSHNFFNHYFLLLITQNINTHIFITIFINLAILAINFFITLQLLFFQLVCKSVLKCFLWFSIFFLDRSDYDDHDKATSYIVNKLLIILRMF